MALDNEKRFLRDHDWNEYSNGTPIGRSYSAYAGAFNTLNANPANVDNFDQSAWKNAQVLLVEIPAEQNESADLLNACRRIETRWSERHPEIEKAIVFKSGETLKRYRLSNNELEEYSLDELLNLRGAVINDLQNDDDVHEETREDRLRMYRTFIERCTKSPASVGHYTDFSRINECINGLLGTTDVHILDYTQANQVQNLIDRLNTYPRFVECNNQGQMYSNSLITYKMFLNARALFSSAHFTQTYFNEAQSMLQKIFFGAPGSGKSHKIDNDLFKDENGNPTGTGLKNIPQDQKFRTTFHPDYDYAQFIGSYKPIRPSPNVDITYSFIPQVFAKAYVAAWQKNLAQEIPESKRQVYLVIEEINRGNCAQIFGDIFQLLDRKDGHSEYPVDVDSDFAEYIRTEMGGNFVLYKNTICSYMENAAAGNAAAENATPDDKFCKIALPPNFNILATMNTSDQSLFPMDSAFKRRFDWEYIAIDYSKTEAEQEIKVGDKKYSWLKFLKAVNEDIQSTTLSEDKQMGEFFVKSNGTIDFKTFRSKVLFYLWDSVYKDEYSSPKVFHFDYKSDPEHTLTFQSLFEGSDRDSIQIVQKIFENLGVASISTAQGEVQGEAVNVDAVQENPEVNGNEPLAETQEQPADV